MRSEPVENIELHEREVLEQNLAVIIPVEGSGEPQCGEEPLTSASGLLSPSASGFLSPSASGFLSPSASGFLSPSASGFLSP